jgi:phage terminase large subunit
MPDLPPDPRNDPDLQELIPIQQIPEKKRGRGTNNLWRISEKRMKEMADLERALQPPKLRIAFPEAFLPWLFEPIPIKVAYGGRGAMKSWQFARAALLKAHTTKTRILCAREYQTSIRDSVHAELKRQIEMMGLQRWFEITDKSIVSTVTGTDFLFKGLHHNITEIKSLSGLGVCWVEEAEAVSEESWRILEPTIREDNSELWISFNPGKPDSATYRRWVVNAPPEAKIVKVGWQDNPWFPSSLDRQRRWMEKTDHEAYMNVWEGFPREVGEATIFRGKYEIVPFEEPERVDRYFYGGDFGFANDPSALVRLYIHDDCLYITHEAYGVGVELDDMPSFYAGGASMFHNETYEGVPGAKDWPIFADSSRPETISKIRRHGFNISPADKWTGCVEDGIAYLKSFRKIYIHPRCRNMAAEAALYSYKVDQKTLDPVTQKPVVLPVVVDAHNHCIARGELVTTARGHVPIEQVVVGDRVVTRGGWGEVVQARQTDVDRPVWSITAGGRTLWLTPDHEVFTVQRGMIRVDALRYDDTLLVTDDPREMKLVHASVESIREDVDRCSVYDLSVYGNYHEFVVGGILVSNCWDSVRYALNGYITRTGVLGPWQRLAAAT